MPDLEQLRRIAGATDATDQLPAPVGAPEPAPDADAPYGVPEHVQDIYVRLAHLHAAQEAQAAAARNASMQADYEWSRQVGEQAGMSPEQQASMMRAMQEQGSGVPVATSNPNNPLDRMYLDIARKAAQVAGQGQPYTNAPYANPYEGFFPHPQQASIDPRLATMPVAGQLDQVPPEAQNYPNLPWQGPYAPTQNVDEQLAMREQQQAMLRQQQLEAQRQAAQLQAQQHQQYLDQSPFIPYLGENDGSYQFQQQARQKLMDWGASQRLPFESWPPERQRAFLDAIHANTPGLGQKLKEDANATGGAIWTGAVATHEGFKGLTNMAAGAMTGSMEPTQTDLSRQREVAMELDRPIDQTPTPAQADERQGLKNLARAQQEQEWFPPATPLGVAGQYVGPMAAKMVGSAVTGILAPFTFGAIAAGENRQNMYAKLIAQRYPEEQALDLANKYGLASGAVSALSMKLLGGYNGVLRPAVPAAAVNPLVAGVTGGLAQGATEATADAFLGRAASGQKISPREIASQVGQSTIVNTVFHLIGVWGDNDRKGIVERWRDSKVMASDLGLSPDAASSVFKLRTVLDAVREGHLAPNEVMGALQSLPPQDQVNIGKGLDNFARAQSNPRERLPSGDTTPPQAVASAGGFTVGDAAVHDRLGPVTVERVATEGTEHVLVRPENAPPRIVKTDTLTPAPKPPPAPPGNGPGNAPESPTIPPPPAAPVPPPGAPRQTGATQPPAQAQPATPEAGSSDLIHSKNNFVIGDEATHPQWGPVQVINVPDDGVLTVKVVDAAGQQHVVPDRTLVRTPTAAPPQETVNGQGQAGPARPDLAGQPGLPGAGPAPGTVPGPVPGPRNTVPGAPDGGTLAGAPAGRGGRGSPGTGIAGSPAAGPRLGPEQVPADQAGLAGAQGPHPAAEPLAAPGTGRPPLEDGHSGPGDRGPIQADGGRAQGDRGGGQVRPGPAGPGPAATAAGDGAQVPAAPAGVEGVQGQGQRGDGGVGAGNRGVDSAEPPPPAPGMVRFYHGGSPYDQGSRWLSPDPKYAAGYASKSQGSTVQYVDIPETTLRNLGVGKAFDDSGTSVIAPYNSFEAPPEIAKGLRPFAAEPPQPQGAPNGPVQQQQLQPQHVPQLQPPEQPDESGVGRPAEHGQRGPVPQRGNENGHDGQGAVAGPGGAGPAPADAAGRGQGEQADPVPGERGGGGDQAPVAGEQPAQSKDGLSKAAGQGQVAATLADAVSEAQKLDPEQSELLIGAYQHAIKASGSPDVAAAWSLYAATRNGVNQNLPNVGTFREKTEHIGKAIFESMRGQGQVATATDDLTRGPFTNKIRLNDYAKQNGITEFTREQKPDGWYLRMAPAREGTGNLAQTPAKAPEAAPAIPDWAREEMLRQGKNPDRMVNDVDAARPKMADQLANDPVTKWLDATGQTELAERAKRGDLSAEEYKSLLRQMKTTAPAAPKPVEEAGTQQEAKQPPKEEPKAKAKKPSDYGKKNKFVTEEEAAKEKEWLKNAFKRLNSGVDPEMMVHLFRLAAYHVEAGSRKFIDFAKAMVEDVGEGVKPYLKQAYSMVREAPEMAHIEGEMTPYAEVKAITNEGIDGILREGKQESANGPDETQLPAAGRGRQAGVEGTGPAGEQPVLQRPAETPGGRRPADAGNALAQGDAAAPPAADRPGRGSGRGESGVESRNGPAGGAGEGDGGARRPAGDQRPGAAAAPARPEAKGEGVPQEPAGRAEQLRELDDRGVAPPDQNHHIAPSDTLAPAGDIGKIKANIKAIELLKKLEAEDRNPTPGEKKVLAQYVGWGGVSQVLDKNKAADWEHIQNWKEEHPGQSVPSWMADTSLENWAGKYYQHHAALRDLLGEAEWRRAVGSTENAHFTSRDVIEHGVWNIARHLGFEGGQVLENSAGIGHMIGLAPEDLAAASHFNAVELDDLTARMLGKLYPQANVFKGGFQDAPIKPNSQDLNVGNYPFAAKGPPDQPYPQQFSLHNYFFARSIDSLKPGGLLVAITSDSTLDSPASAAFRAWAAPRVDFVGAIRLPNNAFKKNAGTEVTTDIVVMRKKDGNAAPYGQAWTNALPMETGKMLPPVVAKDGTPEEAKPETVTVNEYFHAHPEMMLGKMKREGTMYRADQPALIAPAGQDLPAELDKAVKNLPPNIAKPFDPTAVEPQDLVRDRARAGQKEFSYQLDKSGAVRQVRDGQLSDPSWGGKVKIGKAAERQAKQVGRFIDLREATKDLIDLQLSPEADDKSIEAARKDLNRLYDQYLDEHGAVNDKGSRFLSDDPEYPLVASLEHVNQVPVEVRDKKGNLLGERLENRFQKGDIFTKRTIYPHLAPASAENVADAANISRAWKNNIDIPYIARMLGREGDEEGVKADLIAKGLGYEDPTSGLVQSNDEYLSGNVRQKLEAAEAAAKLDPKYKPNVEALKGVQPEPLNITQIGYRLGSSWIPPHVIQDWIGDVLEAPGAANVQFVPEIGQYAVNWDNYALRGSAKNSDTFAGGQVPANDLIEDALNLKSTTAYDYVPDDNGGKPRRVANPERTMAARAAQDRLKEHFRAWVKKSNHIKEMEDLYNRQFNSTKLRDWRGSGLKNYPNAAEVVDGKDFALHPHQSGATARGLTESYLLGHAVGTGKTYTFISTAMEWKRLGLARKPMIVTQNATTEQVVEAFKRLYPWANVLAPTARDFEKGNREKLMSRIATGDYDAVIVAHSQFNLLPDDPARVEGYTLARIAELEEALHNQGVADPHGKIDRGASPTVKELARAMKKLEDRLKTLQERQTDNAITFEKLGIDGLIVDEAHLYKKLEFSSQMDNIKGLDRGASQRGLGLLMKVRHVQEKTGGKNVILSTGTPITNTLAEAWNMLRYVRPDLLKQFGVEHFDQFAGAFTEPVTQMEMNDTGGWKQVTRLAKFANVPELISLFRSGADIVNPEDLNLPKPGLKGGKPTVITIPRTQAVSDYMDELIARYDAWQHMSGREKKEHSSEPLVINGLARKAALDLRLVDPKRFGDEPGSKLNRAIEEIFQRWEAGKGLKTTQAVFADLFQSPEFDTDNQIGTDADGDPIYAAVPEGDRFNAFDEIRRKLVAKGVPLSEIAIIHEHDTKAKRAVLFDRLNSGQTRVVMGTTEKLGIGVNIQKKLATLHQLDAPWRPSDIEQREGRILRQGNENPEVEILRYGTERTFDAGQWQRLATKQRFTNQVMRGDLGGKRSVDDLGAETIANFNEASADISGDPLVREKYETETLVKQLQALADQHEYDQISGRQKAKDRENDANSAANTAKALRHFHDTIAPDFVGEPTVVMPDGKTYTGEEATTALDDEFKGRMKHLVDVARENPSKGMPVKSEWLRGRKVNGLDVPHIQVRVSIDHETGLPRGGAEIEYAVIIPHTNYLGAPEELRGTVTSGRGFIESLKNRIDALPERATTKEARATSLQRQIKELQGLQGQPFEQQEELDKARARLESIKDQLAANTAAEEAARAAAKAAPPSDAGGEGEEAPAGPVSKALASFDDALAEARSGTMDDARRGEVVKSLSDFSTDKLRAMLRAAGFSDQPTKKAALASIDNLLRQESAFAMKSDAITGKPGSWAQPNAGGSGKSTPAESGEAAPVIDALKGAGKGPLDADGLPDISPSKFQAAIHDKFTQDQLMAALAWSQGLSGTSPRKFGDLIRDEIRHVTKGEDLPGITGASSATPAVAVFEGAIGGKPLAKTEPHAIVATIGDAIKDLARGAADQVAYIGQHMFPAISRLAPESGNAASRYVASQTYVQYAAPAIAAEVIGPPPAKPGGTAQHFLDSVLGGAIDKEHSRLFGLVMVQDDLDGLRDHFLAQAKEAAANARKATTPEELARWEDAEAEAMDHYDNVRTYIGPGGEFADDAAFNAVASTPRMQGSIARYKKWFAAEPEANYRVAQRMDPDAPVVGRGRRFGGRVNLVAVKVGEGEGPVAKTVARGNLGEPLGKSGGTRRGNLSNPKLRPSPFAKQAFGNGDAYEVSAERLIHHTLAGGTEIANQARWYVQMVKDGVAKVGSPTLNPEFGDKAGVRLAEIKGQVVILPGKGAVPQYKYLWVHPDIATEARRALNVDDPVRGKFLTGIANAFNVTQLAGVTDATSHMANMFASTVRSPEKRALLAGMGRALYGKVTHDPKVMAHLMDLARIGALKPHHGGSLATWQKATVLPVLMRGASKTIDALNDVMRAGFDDALTAAARKGLIPLTEQNRRDAINAAFGQYNVRAQPWWMAMLRQTALSPFVTANTTFSANAVRTVAGLGAPGMKASSPTAAVRLHAAILGAFAAALGMTALYNWLKWKRMDGADDVPLGAIRLDDTEDGHHRWFDVARLSGLTRGLRVTGTKPVLEGLRREGVKGVMEHKGQYGLDAARDVALAATHPLVGPLPASLLIAGTGYSPGGFRVAKQVPGQAQQFGENITAAVRGMNPAFRETGPTGAGAGFSRQLGPWAPHTGGTPRTHAETMAHGFLSDKYGTLPQRTTAEQEHSRDKAAVVSQVRKLGAKSADAEDAIDEALVAGKVRDEDVADIYKKAGLTQLQSAFKTGLLNADQAARVWNAATADEKKQIGTGAWKAIARDRSVSGEGRRQLLLDSKIPPPRGDELRAMARRWNVIETRRVWDALNAGQKDDLHGLVAAKIGNERKATYREKETQRREFGIPSMAMP